jgi:hypothetical protein
MKNLLFITALLLILLFCIDCRRVGPDVKVYVARPDLGGAYRAQAQELVPWEQTSNYRMMNPGDWELFLNFCLSSGEQAQIIRRELEEKRLAAKQIDQALTK